MTTYDDDLQEEAVMLIGGKFCKAFHCNVTVPIYANKDTEGTGGSAKPSKVVAYDHTV